MRTIVATFADYASAEEIQDIIVDRLNRYILNQQDKAELVSFKVHGEQHHYAMIGTEVTRDNWNAMCQEAFDLSKQG